MLRHIPSKFDLWRNVGSGLPRDVLVTSIRAWKEARSENLSVYSVENGLGLKEYHTRSGSSVTLSMDPGMALTSWL
jgi:hypothetical protein